MKLTEIDAPWGKFKIDTFIDFFKQTRVQLQYFLDNDQSPNPQFTREEIEGYDALITLGCELTAQNFLELKGSYRERGEPVPSNLEIIEILKSQGKWRSES